MHMQKQSRLERAQLGITDKYDPTALCDFAVQEA